MERQRRIPGRRCVMTRVFVVICMLSLSSCSMWSSKSEIKVAKPNTCSVELPPVTMGPYKDVKLDTPASAVCQPKLYVIKGERRLLVVDNDVLVRDYKIALGPRTFGDKVHQGDGKTPEGEFFICVKNPNSRFYKSLGISYPSPRHAERALLDGSITLEEYRNILNADAHKSRPPWNTSLGGAIMIHGGGASEDWTEGCVALYNRSMDELFSIVSVGTPVEILP